MGDAFKALSDPTRRRILELLQDRPLNAGEIADCFQMTKPSISHHFRNERVVKYNEPLFHGQEPQKQAENSRFHREEQMLRKPSVDNIDFEKKLEESLKDL